jgi:hypothetical protein
LIAGVSRFLEAELSQLCFRPPREMQGAKSVFLAAMCGLAGSWRLYALAFKCRVLFIHYKNKFMSGFIGNGQETALNISYIIN